METTAEDLPDDVLLEILALVTDVAALFRCATTCNRWRRLVADPTFLRRRWPDKASSLIGFFAQGRHDRDSIMAIGRRIIPVTPATATAFVPVPPSLFGPGGHSLCSLLPKAAGLFDRSAVVASRHGLLLVRFYPHGARVDRHVHLAVCNLLAGTCDVLPPLRFRSSYGVCNLIDDICDVVDLNSYAILPGADFCSNNGQRRPPLPGYSAFFKVVVIATSVWVDQYNIHTFSSDQPKWSALSTCDALTKSNLFMIYNKAVVRQGTAHWLFWDLSSSSLLMVDVNTMTGHMSMEKIKKPPVAKDYIRIRLSVDAEGMLRLYYLHNKDLSLQIWRRQDKEIGDGRTTDWLHIQTIQLKRHEQQQNIYKLDLWMCLGENSGMSLIVTGKRRAYTIRNRRAYITHLQTGVMEEVTDWFSGLNCETAVPVEIDWPELFTSSLQPRSKLPCDAERRPVATSASSRFRICCVLGSCLVLWFLLACVFSYLNKTRVLVLF